MPSMKKKRRNLDLHAWIRHHGFNPLSVWPGTRAIAGNSQFKRLTPWVCGRIDATDGRRVLKVTILSSMEAHPGTGGYPVLVIPGYWGSAFQTEWVGKHLQSNGLDTVGLKLPWMAMGDMTRSAQIVAEQVTRIRETLGFEKVNLFGYSLGGLIARYYLQELEGYPSLGRGAFVSSPNAGTYFGYIGFFSPAGRQVRPGSSFVRELNAAPRRDCSEARCLSIYVRWDGVIVPSESSYLPYGFNLMRRRPVSHWRATMSREMLMHASEFLRGGLPVGAVPGREVGMLEGGGMFAVPLALQSRATRRFWQVVCGPFRSLASRFASLFHRR